MTTPTVNTADLGTILSVWAHPDDETYLAAGVMAAATDHGQRVVCVSATAGERGTSDPATWPPARLGRVRRWEAAAAMAVVGVAEHRFLGLPDGSLAAHDERGLAMIGQLLTEVQPDTILTFGPDGMTFHPDHVTVSRWVTEACRRSGCLGRLLYATSTVDYLARFAEDFEEWGAYMTDDRPTGVPAEELAIHLVLDGAQLDRKLTALAAMASQTRDLMAMIDPAVYAAQVAEEAFIEAPRPHGRPADRGIRRDCSDLCVSEHEGRPRFSPTRSSEKIIMDELQGIVRFTFHAGMVDEFKRLSAECLEIVRSKDEGTLQYDTYFNDDESQAIVLERFRDSDALILHGQNMAPLMDAIMATANVSGELLGDPNEQLRAQLAGSPVGLFALYQSL